MMFMMVMMMMMLMVISALKFDDEYDVVVDGEGVDGCCV